MTSGQLPYHRKATDRINEEKESLGPLEGAPASAGGAGGNANKPGLSY